MTTARSLLGHSWRMIVRDVPATLRLVLVPWVIMTAAWLGLEYAFYGTFADEIHVEYDVETALDPSYEQWFFGALFVEIVCYVWIGVSWHRYVLEGESSFGWVPKWNTGRSLRYLGKGILATLPLIPIMIPALVLAVVAFEGRAIEPPPDDALNLGRVMYQFIIAAAFSYVTLRVGLILPAIAVGQKLKLRESWRLTKPSGGALVNVAAVLSLAYLVFEIPMSVFSEADMLYLIFYALSDVVTLLGLSMLTTLFGLLVEGRELEG